MTAPIATKTFQVLGKNLNVAVGGKGPALIFIHGWSNNWQGWLPLANVLLKRFTLYLVDLPGFGDSDELEEYSIAEEAYFVNEFITKNNLNPVAVIGASMGTLMAAELVRSYPLTAKTLILVGPVFDNMPFKVPALIYKTFLTLIKKHATMSAAWTALIKSKPMTYAVEKYLNAYVFNKELVDTYSLPGRRKITPLSYVSLGIDAQDYHLEEVLKQIEIPTLLLVGEADRYAPPSLIEGIEERLQKQTLSHETISLAGHNVAYEQPDTAAAAIEKFLGKTVKLSGFPLVRSILARLFGR